MLMLSDGQFASRFAATNLRKSNSFFGVSSQKVGPKRRSIRFEQ
jgi:hypothetical protein